MNLKEEILQKTNRGLEIFCFYMPTEFVPKRNFRNPLYDDKRASCNIYFDTKSQCYRMKDFGNEAYSGDCFWFAATMMGLDVRTEFRKVLAMIIHDLGLNIPVEDRDVSEQRRNYPRNPSPVIRKNIVTETPENKRWFKIYEQPFNEEEKNFWLRYGITDRTLTQYHVKSLFRYEAISSQGKQFTLTSTNAEPMFCYMMGNFVKIYRPKSKLRFLYGGEKLEDYIFGFEQLPNKGHSLYYRWREGCPVTFRPSFQCHLLQQRNGFNTGEHH